MVRAIADHTARFPAWGDCEIRRLYDMEIDASMAQILVARGDARA
jgi:hypothetical protein